MNSKAIIIGVIALLFLGFSIWAISASKQGKNPSAPVVLSDSGQKSGTASAQVTLVEFADFQCPYCKNYEPALAQVRAEYADDIEFIYKHFPLVNAHQNAKPAAIAAEAAGRQGKFWEFHDLLYEKQEEWSVLPNVQEKFVEYASSLELDVDQFAADLKDKTLEDAVNAQHDEGVTAGVSGTPTFFLNGKRTEFAQDFSSFKEKIDAVLKPAN